MRNTLLAAAIISALAACAKEAPANKTAATGAVANNVHGVGVIYRPIDSAKGRALFVEKGCVMCHSVNGVGGKAAPALDAEIGAPPIDPLGFAARMWAGAPAMIELQSLELGYTISLTADEIASLAGFAGDVEEQRKLTIDAVPASMRDSLLNERFWEKEDWEDFLKKGQEGYGEPAPNQGSGDEPAPSPDETTPN
ncbi:MAG TPA: c-type cytochrome [Parvularculaceae bacterium]|nr:c-type cytochrome [Parvularculaceae bacterium]